jgi:hypothetical protein
MQDKPWILVTKKSKIKSRLTNYATSDISVSELNNKLLKYNNLLKSSSIYKELAQFIETLAVKNVVCLGLGPLEHSHSITQLALLEMLCSVDFKKSIYDPVFSAQESMFLQSKNYSTLAIKYPVTAKTIFYMIHCPHELYEQVLAENDLSNVIIVGNSFKEYQELGRFTLFRFKERPLKWTLNNCFSNTSLMYDFEV